MAVPLDNQRNFQGDSPSTEGPKTAFEGTSNPDQGEQTNLDPAIAPNRFPRESGSDSYQGIPGDGVVPG